MAQAFAPLFAIRDPQIAYELQRLHELLRTLQDTVSDMGDTLNRMDVSYLELPDALTAEPALRWAGMICRADRTNWDPLSKGSGGSYLTWYNGTSWAALDQQ